MKLSKFALVSALLVAHVTVTFSQAPLFVAKEKGKKYGYINDRGEYVIAPSFDEAGGFYNGIAVVKKNKLFGVINSKGEFVVPPTYSNAEIYAPEGKVSVMKDGKWGVIDQTGKVIIPFVHEYISVFANGYVVAGKYITAKGYKDLVCPIVLDENNRIVYQVSQVNSFELDTVEQLSEYDCTQLYLPGKANKKNNAYSLGWPIVRNNYLMVYLTLEGGPGFESLGAVDVKKKQLTMFPSGLYPSDFYFGMREGAIALEFAGDTDEDDQFSGEGYYDTAEVAKTYLEKNLFDLSAQVVHPFFNGVAAIEKDGRWQFIDREGWVISETSLSTSDYDATPPMYFNGLIGFWKKGKAGYVDIKGKEVIPFAFDEYHPFEYDVTPVKQNGLYGLLRKDGTWAVSPKFESLVISPCPCYQAR